MKKFWVSVVCEGPDKYRLHFKRFREREDVVFVGVFFEKKHALQAVKDWAAYPKKKRVIGLPRAS